jgi:DnaJ-class molecular chaperone
MHTKDSDCTIGPDDTCTKCGVTHGDPCPMCKGRGFHKTSCSVFRAASNDDMLFVTVKHRPEDVDAKIRKALLAANAAAAKADELTERAHMDLYAGQHIITAHAGHPQGIVLGAKAEKTSKILMSALKELGDAREKLGNAVHKIGKALRAME